MSCLVRSTQSLYDVSLPSFSCNANIRCTFTVKCQSRTAHQTNIPAATHCDSDHQSQFQSNTGDNKTSWLILRHARIGNNFSSYCGTGHPTMRMPYTDKKVSYTRRTVQHTRYVSWNLVSCCTYLRKITYSRRISLKVIQRHRNCQHLYSVSQCVRWKRLIFGMYVFNCRLLIYFASTLNQTHCQLTYGATSTCGKNSCIWCTAYVQNVTYNRNVRQKEHWVAAYLISSLRNVTTALTIIQTYSNLLKSSLE